MNQGCQRVEDRGDPDGLAVVIPNQKRGIARVADEGIARGDSGGKSHRRADLNQVGIEAEQGYAVSDNSGGVEIGRSSSAAEGIKRKNLGLGSKWHCIDEGNGARVAHPDIMQVAVFGSLSRSRINNGCLDDQALVGDVAHFRD